MMKNVMANREINEKLEKIGKENLKLSVGMGLDNKESINASSDKNTNPSISSNDYNSSSKNISNESIRDKEEDKFRGGNFVNNLWSERMKKS
jgi:hypothetical protein